ncbi:hypothetical protein E2986_11566 [Frieseomelitta varia]|uniref:Odorant receptor n=1 Tax=Frieseomelitta varia TaxID=561572 RepID=A0A833W142_9HYME|nr:hypothetical protein E2986_11566 [Frieseomelitta varia]
MTVHTLQCSRILLSICGCLPPSSWTSSFTKSLYNIYTSFVWLLILSLASAQILDIIINVENQDQFSDNFYITLVVFVSGCKLSIMLKHRRSILSLIDSLENEPFSTTNDEEMKIRSKFNKMNERIAIGYTILVEVAAISIFVRSYFTDFKKRKLTFRAWLPYDYSELLPYAFSYAYEVTTSMLCSCQNVACDTLFAGLLIQIYSQFEILGKRLGNIQKNENHSAKQCVKHYQKIYNDNLYATLIFFSSCCKSLMSLIYRGDIEISLDALLEEPFVPVNTEEDKIQMKFEGQIDSWTSFTKFMYNIYTSFVWLLILSLMSAQTVDIIINVENQDHFSDNFYVTLLVLSVVFVNGCKLSIMLKHRRSILSLIDSLEDEPFSTTNDEEVKIRSKFNKMNERIAIGYAILVEVAAILMFVRSFFTDFKKRKLVFRAWLPYDYSKLLPYVFSYTYEVTTSMLCTCQSVACDTLFVGLLIQIYSQFEILGKRLGNIQKDENHSAKQCVKHYQKIYNSWTSSFTKSLYNIYTLFVWLLIFSLASAQILDIIINVENQDQFSDNFYITLVVFVCGCKLSIMLKNRRTILSLIDSLENEPFSTINDEEVEIRSKINKMNERIAIVYTILVEVAAVSIFVRSYFTDFKKRKLTFRAWLPYDYSELLPYVFSYAYQGITAMLCSCQSVACDTLFSGLLIQIYSQFEILGKRLKNIQKDENHSAKQCVKHYQKIYKFSRTVNEKFKTVIFLQFCSIAFTLCFNLYRMTNITIVLKFLEASLYLIRTIAQILYYCWCSNEVKLKSLEVPGMIFNSNWTSWDVKTKKILLVLMTRTTRPIEFTSGYLVTLNIESFVAVTDESVVLGVQLAETDQFHMSAMRVLRWTFLLFTLCGCFPPPSWKTPLKRFVYNIYAAFSFLVLNSFFLSQILDMVYNVENTDDFSDNFSVTVVVFVTSLKLFTILIFRENFLLLCDTLQREPLLPMNPEEFDISFKFEKITDLNTLGYMTLLTVSDFCILVLSLLTNFKRRKLAFRTWIPFDYSSVSAYLLTFAYQCLFAIICTFGCVASDTLYSGLLIHINCQFEILEHRLRNIESNENYSVNLCVRHHNDIYRFGEMVNEEFRTIMFFQFCTSLSMICFNFYRITQIEMDSRFVGTILYMTCSLMQIFYYCWFSNEVKLKSMELSDMIFRSDWISLNTNVKKAFLMLMKRAMKPIEFTSIYIVSVNLESFMTVSIRRQQGQSCQSIMSPSGVKIAMHVLRWTLKLSVANGCFLPPTLKSPMKRFLYNLYTVFMTFHMWSITAMEILDIFYNVETQEDLTGNIGNSASVFITSCKYINLVLKRRTIINILDLLKNKPFLPENAREMEIHARYNNLTE